MKKKFKKISIFNARVTSTVSVSLVLLILGIVALTGIAASNITRDIKENLGFDVLLVEDADPEGVGKLEKLLRSQPYARSVSLFTPEEAAAQWKESTGEDIIEIVGVNPFSAELDVKVKAEYASTDSLTSISARVSAYPLVEEVSIHSEMVDSINRNMHTAMIVMLIVAVALMLISFVLINNTIRLTVYSKRFIIHTMKLVGATSGFIRRPFIRQNVVNGLVAGVIAGAVLTALLVYAGKVDPAVSKAVPAESTAIVIGLMLVAGMLICGVAAMFATDRYLKVDYDDMFD